ncbi:MAG: DUF3300 domain-containing protein [Rhodobacterales bacterium]|nr:DUF3300 domain-containing protein [Rhodobacterales bacterium]
MRVSTSMKVMAVLLGTALPLHHPAFAQEAPASGDAAAGAEAEALFTAEELDTLMAPIALYPDALLAQVLMATTYPVDVLKADRFLTKNAGLDDKARSALAADEEWADPVRELTAGFPELISRMAEHMDWTEQTGNAVLAATNDVLDSLQRLRAQASLNGYLVDNEAMTVDEDADSGNITISSKDPEVVYVPQYTETVYTQPAPATPVYVTNDDNWNDLLVTGAVVWGSAIILDEIFDDDDWDGGRDHWYGGGYGGGNGNGNSIDWDGDINVDNGINIGNGNGNGIGNGNGNGIGNRPGNGGGVSNIGDLQRPETLPGKLGDVDSDRLRDRKDGTFKPSDASRDEAREKIAKSKNRKDGVATLPAATGKRDLGVMKDGKKPAVKLPPNTKEISRGDRKPAVATDKMAKPKKPAIPNTDRAVRKTAKAPVYLPSTGNRGNAASLRGKKSLKGNR